MRRKYLLGATVDKELVFEEIEVRDWNGHPEFSASFDTVRPINGNDYDLEEYFEGWLEDIDAQWKWDDCVKRDCSPNELAAELADECDDPRDALDCSLYPECVEVDGEDWYFESGSCGQYDTRDIMETYINKAAYDKLIALWDKYHLKEIDDTVEAEIKEVENIKR